MVDIYRLSQLCLEQIVTAIGLVCSTIHLTLTHPTTTELNNRMCKYVNAFIARSLFPVASCILTSMQSLELAEAFRLAFLLTDELIRRRGHSTRINNRVPPILIPTWRQLIGRLLKSVF